MQATVIGVGNQSCIKLAINPVTHKRSKHIDTKSHFIRQKVDDKSVQLVYTPTNQLAADEITSTSESGETSKATSGSITDSSSRKRNNLSGGVEKYNWDKILELQTLDLSLKKAQNSEETN